MVNGTCWFPCLPYYIIRENNGTCHTILHRTGPGAEKPQCHPPYVSSTKHNRVNLWLYQLMTLNHWLYQPTNHIHQAWPAFHRSKWPPTVEIRHIRHSHGRCFWRGGRHRHRGWTRRWLRRRPGGWHGFFLGFGFPHLLGKPKWGHSSYYLVGGFNSEKYESVGMMIPFPTEWKVIIQSCSSHHQPDH